MRQSFTATIERNTVFTESFETEPYEAGWASEARWFIRILEISGEGTSLQAFAQISPDGLHWCDEGANTLVMNKPSLHSLPLENFGNWLRLRCELSGQNPSVKVLICLALKE